VKASPLARKRAVELGVALEGVTGTGREGAVTRADVELAGAASREAGQTSVALGEGRVVEQIAPTRRTAVEQQASMRRSIAALMSRSKREIPHYYISTTIDFSASAAWLQQENLSRTPERRLLPAALLLKAVALAVKAVPEMNGFFVDDAFQQSPKVHLGVAIALRQGGLIAPAIHDADLLGLDEVMSALKDLVNRARSGKLKSSEMADPTITVTNLGDQGVESVFGVIYPPQVALVGFGKISERPWAVAGMIGVRPLVIATLAADHRVSDGHRGSRFLAAIDRYLQQPEGL
jgi:pyruvate dehydrogenase E2 component (dihydrolipoamide acetyltransferase)